MKPTEHEKQIARKLAKAYFGDSPLEDALYLDALAVMTAAKQQKNEDAARLDWLEGRLTNWRNIFGSLDPNTGRYFQIDKPTPESTFRAAIDAARGVQPAAKEECGYKDCGLLEGHPHIVAAQQPSAPTPEQQTETGGQWRVEKTRNGSGDQYSIISLGTVRWKIEGWKAAEELVAAHNAALAAKDEQLRVMREAVLAETAGIREETAALRRIISAPAARKQERKIEDFLGKTLSINREGKVVAIDGEPTEHARKQESAPAAEQESDHAKLHQECAHALYERDWSVLEDAMDNYPPSPAQEKPQPDSPAPETLMPRADVASQETGDDLSLVDKVAIEVAWCRHISVTPHETARKVIALIDAARSQSPDVTTPSGLSVKAKPESVAAQEEPVEASGRIDIPTVEGLWSYLNYQFPATCGNIPLREFCAALASVSSPSATTR